MSMLRNLAVSLINSRDERIVTTLPKAKELRPFVERVITLSRKATNLEGDDTGPRALHLRRQAAGFFHAGNMQQAALTGKRGQVRPERTAGIAALRRLFDELGERYKDRPGGYTRILKLGHRAGDNAEVAIIELVGNRAELEALEAAKKRKTTASTSKKKKGGETKGTAASRGKAAAATTKASTKDTEAETAVAADAPEQATEEATEETGKPADEAGEDKEK
jgi:large subunit ribosomal protein L17